MPRKPLTHIQFRNQLLTIMSKKHHWAWPHFMGKSISKDQLKIHFQQEYGVYVRDFPVFLARIHGQNPPPEVRGMLAENIYEEDTGQLSLGQSHPELFLTMMKGVGFQVREFDRIRLLPASRRYRAWLDQISTHRDWVVGAAVFTIFVEGSIQDRQEIRNPPKPKTRNEVEAYVRRHPLVRNQGVSRKCMDLIRAHQMVEAGHRHDAYQMVVNYATTRRQQESILAVVRKTMQLWILYRDSIAHACKLQPR